MTGVGTESYVRSGAEPPGGRVRAGGTGTVRGRRLGVLALAAGAALSWLPFVGKQLSPDEGGFLLVASQWSPGTSLYGDYWVDRPPLLIALFGVADRLGGAVGLRLIGIAFVVVAVFLAAALGALTSGPAARDRVLIPAAVAAIFLSTPLFGTTAVDGELLAIPFVLGGVVALIRSCLTEELRSAILWAALAGVLAAGAALVKQNVVDVFVFAAVLIGQLAWTRGRGAAVRRLGAFSVGAVAATALAVVGAATRGTSPGGLWDAVIRFRFDATTVIQASAVETIPERFHGLVIAFLWSGAPLVLVAALLRFRAAAVQPADRRAGPRVPDLRWPAAAMITWELAAVVLGGSYWLHYLIGVVPGMVLLVVAAGQRPRSRAAIALLVALVYAVGSGIVSVAWTATHMPNNASDALVVDYLRAHSQQGDTVVVGFGHPNIVWDSGMSSPYPELWSLPVRVRDSGLAELTTVFEGDSRPTWVVVSGLGLATWGVDPATAQAQLDSRYRQVVAIDGYLIYHVD